MQTTIHLPTSTWKMFSDRCQNLGLETGPSLRNAIYLTMMNDPKSWTDDFCFEECCKIHDSRMTEVSLNIGDKFWLDWRKTFKPKSTMESATINLAIRKWNRLSRETAHNVDYTARHGQILNIR